MRDLMNWSVPVFRAFGIPVRVHLFFIVIVIGLFFRPTCHTLAKLITCGVKARHG